MSKAKQPFSKVFGMIAQTLNGVVEMVHLDTWVGPKMKTQMSIQHSTLVVVAQIFIKKTGMLWCVQEISQMKIVSFNSCSSHVDKMVFSYLSLSTSVTGTNRRFLELCPNGGGAIQQKWVFNISFLGSLLNARFHAAHQQFPKWNEKFKKSFSLECWICIALIFTTG